MKKFAIAALTAALVSAAAHAAVVKFEQADGTTSTWTFNADGTTSSDTGLSGTYTWDEASLTICGQIEEQELCATFDEMVDEAGEQTGYTTNTGVSGTATLVEAPAKE